MGFLIITGKAHHCIQRLRMFNTLTGKEDLMHNGGEIKCSGSWFLKMFSAFNHFREMFKYRFNHSHDGTLISKKLLQDGDERSFVQI